MTHEDVDTRLLGWLMVAAKSIDVTEGVGGWLVQISNGQTGIDREAATVATCPSEHDAELVAAGLRKLANG